MPRSKELISQLANSCHCEERSDEATFDRGTINSDVSDGSDARRLLRPPRRPRNDRNLRAEGLILFALLFGWTGHAVLPEGQILLRQDAWYMTAKSYYFGYDLREYDGGNGQCVALAGSTSASFGIGRKLQVDTRISYQRNFVAKGTIFSHVPNDKLEGISEIGFKLSREVWRSIDGAEVTAFLGVRAPGNPYTSPDDFLGISDGAAKYDIGANLYYPISRWGLMANFRYIVRSDPSFDQIALDLQAPYNLFSTLQLGPSITLLHTFDGLDINTAPFDAIGTDLGGGTRKPFPRVKEQVVALGAIMAWALDESLSLDLAFYSKVAGRNTDKGSNIALGVNYLF